MTQHTFLFLAAILLAGLFTRVLHAVQVRSPDGRLVVDVAVKDEGGMHGCPVYTVAWRGRTIIAESRLGLDAASGSFADHLEIVRSFEDSHNQIWHPLYGERTTIRDHYNQLDIHLRDTRPPHNVLHLVFRVYNAGAAFRYVVPLRSGPEAILLRRENTEFRFTADHTAWATYSAQGTYAKVPLSKIRPGCERPLVVQLDQDLYTAVAEARLIDYARMKFAPLPDRPYTLVADLGSEIRSMRFLDTPWRVIMVADSPGRLIENNDILLNLNDASAIPDTSWIKPGKVLREVTLTTTGGKACIDFAVKRHLQYVEFDAGWYGPENSDASDARSVNVDPKRSRGPLDLQEVLRYARDRNIGIWLYVNHRALERQLGEILPLYHSWGVKGVKFGFVNVGSQQWTTWLHDAVRKAAQHQLMVDVHDEYRPTGASRTWPNLLTQEGIAGDETAPSNELTLTILFTRMLAGAADNTICYYDARVDRNASHAYQLAKAVCLYSPLQFLYWYDRPAASPRKIGGAGGAESTIGDEPELEFYDHVPTVWNDTKVIHGRIGEYAVIARRSGDNWFVGGMNDATPRTLDLSLDFLSPAVGYTAHVYCDDAAVPTRTHVRIDRIPVTGKTTLRMAFPARGGQAIRLTPISR